MFMVRARWPPLHAIPRQLRHETRPPGSASRARVLRWLKPDRDGCAGKAAVPGAECAAVEGRQDARCHLDGGPLAARLLHGLREAGDAGRDRAHRQGPVAEQEPELRRRRLVVRRDRVDADARARWRAARARAPARCGRPRNHATTCRPAFAPTTAHAVAEMLRRARAAAPRGARRSSRASGGCGARTRRSAMKSASASCSRNGAAAVGEELGARERLDEGARQDEIPDAQRRKHHLREGADVDHALAVVERLQRVERPAAEAVLAVVVVLEDVGARARRPREQARRAGDTA